MHNTCVGEMNLEFWDLNKLKYSRSLKVILKVAKGRCDISVEIG